MGISGASGAVYGVRILEELARLGVETDLVVSKAAALTIRHELDRTVSDVATLATRTHAIGDVGATLSSGSYRSDGMVVAPCSVKTLSAIVNSYDDNLLIRAADVALKERRPLVLLFRETPLHLGHLRLLTSAAELGARVFPPVPSFYHRPETLADVVDQTVSRVLDQFGLDNGFSRWDGDTARRQPAQGAGSDSMRERA